MSWVFVGVLGGVGALARFELGTYVARRSQGSFPTGTLAINVLGSFLAGVVWALDLPAQAGTLASTGFLGGFTTFSTWMVETGRLWEDDETARRALMNLVLMLSGGGVGVVLGVLLGRLFS